MSEAPKSIATNCVKSILDTNVWESDPELFDLMKQEKKRQLDSLELIASENFTSLAVLQCLSSSLHNKYSEGLPGKRYYGGNVVIDQVERLAQSRSLKAFNLDPLMWGVNVQSYSGSPANFAVYTAVAGPHGRIMGLDLPDGGHLTHGFASPTKKVSATSLFFESMPYKVDPITGIIDYDQLEKSVKLFRPKVIVAGISCYSRVLDYKRFRHIADSVGAFLFSDMSHISGLVAAEVTESPFKYSDIVTTTTHKSLRGPRAAIIFYRKGVRRTTEKGVDVMYDLEEKINSAVFPGLQGGPHNNAIAAIATVMKQAMSNEFTEYTKQVLANAKYLASTLQSRGYKIVTGGTDVHLLLVDLRDTGVTGGQAEHILEEINIACNKNTVPGDINAFNPSGIRFGTPALTTRGFKEEDMHIVADFIESALKVAQEVAAVTGSKLLEFKAQLRDVPAIASKIDKMKADVIAFSNKYPHPGHAEY